MERFIDEVRLLTADTFGVDIDDLPEDASSATYAQWSSLNPMVLMASIEERYGLRLSMDGMTRLSSLDSIVAFLKATSATTVR